MTKKDFIALADALRREKPGKNWDLYRAVRTAKQTQWALDVEAISLVCAASNPRFNKDKWLKHIGRG